MLPADVEVVQRLLDAFNADDLGALDALDENAELQDEPRMPGSGDSLCARRHTTRRTRRRRLPAEEMS
jgi:hypothetical protein